MLSFPQLCQSTALPAPPELSRPGCAIMQTTKMSAPEAPSSSHVQWPSRLLLWLAAALFVVQVAVHASTPADMNMTEWLTGALTGTVTTDKAGHPATMPGMHPADAVPGHSGPAGSGHSDHAKGLCCMPPVALVPALWTLPLSVLTTRPLTPPKAIHEALRLLRATAHGPPLERVAGVQAV